MGTPTIVYKEDTTMNEKCSHNFKMVTGVLTFATYTTNGVTFDLRKKLPTEVHYVAIEPKGGFVAVYDYTNRKIKIFEAGADGDALDEVGSGQAIAGTMSDTHFIAFGK